MGLLALWAGTGHTAKGEQDFLCAPESPLVGTSRALN